MFGSMEGNGVEGSVSDYLSDFGGSVNEQDKTES